MIRNVRSTLATERHKVHIGVDVRAEWGLLCGGSLSKRWAKDTFPAPTCKACIKAARNLGASVDGL